jgi:hypothetical protein
LFSIHQNLRALLEKPSSRTIFVGGKSGPIYKALEHLILDHFSVVEPSEAREWSSLREVDLIVIDDAHLVGPDLLPLLKKLSSLADNQLLLVSMPNLSNIESLGTLLSGDLPGILQDPLHTYEPKMLARGSAFKLLLDSGWLPHVEGCTNSRLTSMEPLIGLIEASKFFGVSENSSSTALQAQTFFISARPSPRSILSQAPINISVIVPVNNESQFSLNAQLSPGIKEIGAEIIPVRGASSAADAFYRGAASASGQWLLFIHQDVYLPQGSGWLLASELDQHFKNGDFNSPVGFVGVFHRSESPESEVCTSGTVTDRCVSVREPVTSNALSLDELGVVIHTSSSVRIDHRLGWHCWATDLSLQAEAIHGNPSARTLDVPVFHNSVNGQLTIDYWQSAEVLLNKYPDRDCIVSLCAQLTRGLVQSELKTLRKNRRRKQRLNYVKSRLRALFFIVYRLIQYLKTILTK